MRSLALLVAAPLLIGATDQPGVPDVEIVMSGLLERYCALNSPAKPDPAAFAEMQQRLPEFVGAWERDGIPLLRETVAVTGIPYDFHDVLLTLHTCPDMSSMSAPPIIAVARYTRAAGANAESGLVQRAAREGRLPLPVVEPRPVSDFVYTLWHELQHRYARQLKLRMPGGATPLMTRYAAENDTVRDHLHLFAIERLVLRRLGREQEYFTREKALRDKGYANYVRATEIVDAETPEHVLADLQGSLKHP